MARPLYALMSICDRWLLDTTKIEEDLAEFHFLDKQLLDMTQARNTTATRLLDSSPCWNIWKRFKERNPQRVEDIGCLENYLDSVRSDNNIKHSRFKATISAVNAAHSRILRDQYDLHVILASVDNTHKYSVNKHDREIERLEQRVAGIEQAIAGVSDRLKQTFKAFDDLDEERRVWGVTHHDIHESRTRMGSDYEALRLRMIELWRQQRHELRALRRRKARRWISKHLETREKPDQV